MKLEQYHTAVRLDLTDPAGATPLFTDNEIDRALERAILDLSRWVPRERIHELTVEGATVTDTIASFLAATHSPYSTSRKLIKVGSVIITNTTTGLVLGLDTDYEVDYANGTITWLNVPTVAHALTIAYTLSNIAIDITDLDDFINVGMIEYPGGNIPQESLSWTTWGDFLYLTAFQQGSQRTLADNTHVLLYYYARHTMPEHNSDGSIPENLAEVMVKGTGAYLLFIRAVGQEFTAKDDITNARTQLTAAVAAQATVTAALTEADTQLDAAITAMANLNAQLIGVSSSADADLDGLAAILTQVDTDLTDADTALDNANNQVANIDNQINEADDQLDEINGAVNDMENEVDEADSAYGSVAFEMSEGLGNMALGATRIDTVAVGSDPAGQHGEYADIHTRRAAVIIQEANDHINAAALHARRFEAYVGAANAYVAAARIRAEATGADNEIAIARLRIAETRLGKTRALIDSAGTRTAIAGALAREAEVRVTAALGFVQLAAQYVENVKQYLVVADGHFRAADASMNLAIRFREEGQARLVEFTTILMDRNQTRRDRSVVSVRQPR